MQSYRERFNDIPPQFADYGYDVIRIVKECGIDSGCMKMSRVGVLGPLTFYTTGRRLGTFVMKQLRGGKFERMQGEIDEKSSS